MVRHDKISLRYAKAIFAFFGTVEKVLSSMAELTRFLDAYKTSPELQRLVTSGVCPAIQRRDIVDDIVKKLGVADASRRILLVLAENGRLGNLESILATLKQFCLESKGVQALKIESAIELKAGDKSKVEEKFKKVLGKAVEAEYVLNPTLFGGLRVTAGSRTFDGTLSGWLTSLEENLVGGSYANYTR